MMAFIAAHAVGLGVTIVVLLFLVAAWSPLLCRSAAIGDRVKQAGEGWRVAEGEPRKQHNVPTWEETREAQRQFMEAWGELPQYRWPATREELERWQAEDWKRRAAPALRDVLVDDGRVVDGGAR